MVHATNQHVQSCWPLPLILRKALRQSVVPGCIIDGSPCV